MNHSIDTYDLNHAEANVTNTSSVRDNNEVLQKGTI